MTLVLRPGRLDEPDALELIEQVQQYYEQIYGARDDDPLDPQAFVPPAGRFLLGYAGAAAVAMGGWSWTGELPGAAKIRRMFVRPDVRRHGHAATLLDALEADARTAGAQRTVLTTGTPQAAAVRFYRARGYTAVEPFGFYADVPTAVHLGKSL